MGPIVPRAKADRRSRVIGSWRHPSHPPDQAPALARQAPAAIKLILHPKTRSKPQAMVNISTATLLSSTRQAAGRANSGVSNRALAAQRGKPERAGQPLHRPGTAAAAPPAGRRPPPPPAPRCPGTSWGFSRLIASTSRKACARGMPAAPGPASRCPAPARGAAPAHRVEHQHRRPGQGDGVQHPRRGTDQRPEAEHPRPPSAARVEQRAHRHHHAQVLAPQPWRSTKAFCAPMATMSDRLSVKPVKCKARSIRAPDAGQGPAAGRRAQPAGGRHRRPSSQQLPQHRRAGCRRRGSTRPRSACRCAASAGLPSSSRRRA